MTEILIPLRKKYKVKAQPKSVKNTKAGNGKRERKGKINWGRSSGLGDKAARG